MEGTLDFTNVNNTLGGIASFIFHFQQTLRNTDTDPGVSGVSKDETNYEK